MKPQKDLNRIAEFNAAFFIGRSMRKIEFNVDNYEKIKEESQILCDKMFKEITSDTLGFTATQLQTVFKTWLQTKRKISSY